MLVKVGAAAGQAAPSSGPGRPQFARFHDAMERYLARERLLRALGHEPPRGPRLLQRGDREAGRPRGPEAPRERAATEPR
jgi:hypothetical protein